MRSGVFYTHRWVNGGVWYVTLPAHAPHIPKGLHHSIAGYRTGLLTWYGGPISTGPMEGTNNKIRTMKRQGYGYRDIEFFKFKIMALNGKSMTLVR